MGQTISSQIDKQPDLRADFEKIVRERRAEKEDHDKRQAEQAEMVIQRKAEKEAHEQLKKELKNKIEELQKKEEERNKEINKIKNDSSKTNYQETFEQCKKNIGDNERSPCEKLLILRESLVKLQQNKEELWPVPCWRGWPCLFTQDRSQIDIYKEQLEPMRLELESACARQRQLETIPAGFKPK